MAGPFTASDSVVGPVVHQIALLIAAQIPSISTIYERPIDRAPADNCAYISLVHGKVINEQFGKVAVLYTFSMEHVFRRAALSDSIERAYTYIMPWLQLLTAWPNQSLGNLARAINTTDLKVNKIAISGQAAIVLTVDFNVLTEFNVAIT